MWKIQFSMYRSTGKWWKVQHNTELWQYVRHVDTARNLDYCHHSKYTLRVIQQSQYIGILFWYLDNTVSKYNLIYCIINTVYLDTFNI